jgi:hypothetical protein
MEEISALPQELGPPLEVTSFSRVGQANLLVGVYQFYRDRDLSQEKLLCLPVML